METTGCRRAGFFIRLVAYLVDSLILWLASYLAGATGLNRFWVSFLLGAAYFTYFFSTTGQTLGKRLLGLRVVRVDGELLNLTTGLTRYLGYLISGFLLFFGFLMIAVDKDCQGLHDKLAGTFVVKE